MWVRVQVWYLVLQVCNNESLVVIYLSELDLGMRELKLSGYYF